MSVKVEKTDKTNELKLEFTIEAKNDKDTPVSIEFTITVTSGTSGGSGGGGSAGGGGAIPTTEYKITVKEGENGKVTPNGTVSVEKGK